MAAAFELRRLKRTYQYRLEPLSSGAYEAAFVGPMLRGGRALRCIGSKMVGLMRIDVSVLRILSTLRAVNSKLATHQNRLATGKRINSAGDDPANLVFANTLESKIRGLAVARNNIGDVQNLTATAEGGVESIVDILLIMKEKILQAGSDTLGVEERTAVESQLDELASEIDDIVASTTYGANTLLDGSFTGRRFQLGATSAELLAFDISQDHHSAGLNVTDSELDVSSAAAASTALANVNAAISTVNSTLQALGSIQQRIGVKESNISIAINNQLAAHNRMMNADMTAEQMESIKQRLLQQTTIAILAQALQTSSHVLRLFVDSGLEDAAPQHVGPGHGTDRPKGTAPFHFRSLTSRQARGMNELATARHWIGWGQIAGEEQQTSMQQLDLGSATPADDS